MELLASVCVPTGMAQGGRERDPDSKHSLMPAIATALSVPVTIVLRSLSSLARGHPHTHLSSAEAASGFSSDLGRTNSGGGLALGTEGDSEGDKPAWPTEAPEGGCGRPRGCGDPRGFLMAEEAMGKGV